MTIQQLKLFMAVAETLNYSRAAEKSFITRQALRQSIASLEQELGSPLFENKSNHISLTEKGKKFYRDALPAVSAFSELERSLKEDYSADRTIRLGVSLSLIPDYLPELHEHLDAFRTVYPRLQLCETDLPNDALASGVMSGTIDCALIIDLRSGVETLERTELSSHPLAILMSGSDAPESAERLDIAALGGHEVCIPGDGEEFAPLLKCPGLPENVRFTVLASYYQVYYRVLEDRCFALNRMIPGEYGRNAPVKNLPLEGMPPLCSAFLTRRGENSREILALRDFLREKIKEDFQSLRTAR